MQTADDWINERLNKLHMIKLAKLMPEAAAGEILKRMPSDQIFEQSQFIEFIKKDVSILEDDLINQAIEILVNQKQLIQVEKDGKVYYRKMSELR